MALQVMRIFAWDIIQMKNKQAENALISAGIAILNSFVQAIIKKWSKK